MNILVLIKKVPDPNLPEQFISVSADGAGLQFHAASQYAINPYDLNAVECAVGLKEAHGGTVTVMTAGDASVETYLRRAVSVGADRAVRVDASAEVCAEPHATARALAGAIRDIGLPDLILAGRQASDTDAGLVPHAVAVALGLPSLSPVVSLGAVAEGTVVAGKLSERTIDAYEVRLPAVLCVSNEISKPRVPTIKGVMLSKKTAIDLRAAATGGVPASGAAYALKSGSRTAEPVVYKDCSDDEKARALLEALGV